MSPTELRSLVEATPTEDLPQLIGELEAAKAVAWSRLTAPAADTPELPHAEARNLDIAEAAKQRILALLDPVQRPRPPVPRARRQDA